MPSLTDVADEVGDYMDRILKLFKPGGKITVLVRRPGEPTQDFLMTNDDLAEARMLIERRQAAGETKA